MMLRGKFRYIVENGFYGFNQTPPYMFYVSSAGYPLNMIMNLVCTHWDGLLYTMTGVPNVYEALFRKGFIRPSQTNLQKFMLNETFVKNVLTRESVKNPDWKVWMRGMGSPINTPLARLILTTPLLERVRDTPHWRSEMTFDHLIQIGEAHIKSAILPYLHPSPTPRNEWFINGMDVREYIGTYPLLITDDNFAFCEDDFEYLIEKRSNPFNRKPLTDSDLRNVCKLKYICDEWWYSIGFPFSLSEIQSSVSPSVKLLTEQIDRFLDKSPYFVYTDRLSDLIGNLDSVEKVSATYLCLLSTPSLVVTDTDVFSQLCIPFKCFNDCLQTENVNFFYGTRISQGMEGDTLLDVSRINLLCWMLNVLETTAVYESIDKLNGRVFSLYTVLKNFVKRITSQI
jgi:hypothetical protein